MVHELIRFDKDTCQQHVLSTLIPKQLTYNHGNELYVHIFFITLKLYENLVFKILVD